MRLPYDILLRDALSEITRSERKFLILVSAVGLTVLHVGLVPTRIDALGIEFSQIDQKTLLRALAAAVLYFLVGFIVYGLSDFVAWRRDLHMARRDTKLDQLRKNKEYEEVSPRQPAPSPTAPFVGLEPFRRWEYESRSLLRSEFPVSLLRAMFDFLLPIVVGVVASIQLLSA
jgi:hypothetical protein